MFFDPDRQADAIPNIPTPDEIAARFAVPLFTFAAQDAMEEASGGTGNQTRDGHPVMETATLSYTLWRNPADHDDPVNLAELTDEMRSALAMEPVRELPPALLEIRERMRYPFVWDAVRTTHISDGSTWHTLELALVEHVNYIVMNRFRDERVAGGFPGELVDRVTGACIERDVPVIIDDTEVAGIRIDTDPHVFGVAADLGDRMLTAAIARDQLPLMRLAFASRH